MMQKTGARETGATISLAGFGRSCAFGVSCRPTTGYINKENRKNYILVLLIGIRLRRNSTGDTRGMLMNLEIETDRRSLVTKTSPAGPNKCLRDTMPDSE